MATTDRAAPLRANDAPSAQPNPAPQPAKLLIYGPSGVGKTALAGTAEDDPRTSPVLFLDLENGARTIAWRNKAIKVMTPEDFHGDLETVLEAVRSGKALHRPTGQPFKSVVIDTITEGSTMVQDAILHGPRSRTASPDVLEYGEWNNYTHRLAALIRGFRDAGLHAIVLAQEAAEDNLIRPSVEGKKAREHLPRWFDIVGRLFIARQVNAESGEVKLTRRLLLQSDGLAVVKSRGDAFSQLPATLANPTIATILDRDEQGTALALTYAQEHYGY